MFELVKAPTKPYKDFFDFLYMYDRLHGGYPSWKERHPGKHPCPTCRGNGGVRDPKDRDPVEGYKMAPMYPCTACNATGETTTQYLKARYKQEMDAYREKYKNYRALLTEQKIAYAVAKAALTPEQMQILGLR